jgi:hypothetical protein
MASTLPVNFSSTAKTSKMDASVVAGFFENNRYSRG